MQDQLLLVRYLTPGIWDAFSSQHNAREHGLGAHHHCSASRVPALHAWHAPGRKVQGQSRSEPLQHLKPLA